MRGRKPKPTHLRLVEGNPGRRPLNKREPKPSGQLRDAPRYFNAAQREIWAFAIDSAPLGLLRCLDRDTLAIWVVAAEMHQRAVEQQARIDAVSALPMLTKTPDGFLVQSPYMPIINKQAMIMLKAASELGFTPSSRSRITLLDDNGNEDPSSAYLD